MVFDLHCPKIFKCRICPDPHTIHPFALCYTVVVCGQGVAKDYVKELLRREGRRWQGRWHFSNWSLYWWHTLCGNSAVCMLHMLATSRHSRPHLFASCMRLCRIPLVYGRVQWISIELHCKKGNYEWKWIVLCIRKKQCACVWDKPVGTCVNLSLPTRH